MAHKFKREKMKWFETINFPDIEWDVMKKGKQVVAFKGGTDTPVRVWNNVKDYLFTKKLLTFKTSML